MENLRFFLCVCALVLLRDVFMAHCKSFNITLTKRGALVNSHCCVFCSIKDCEFDFHTVKHTYIHQCHTDNGVSFVLLLFLDDVSLPKLCYYVYKANLLYGEC